MSLRLPDGSLFGNIAEGWQTETEIRMALLWAAIYRYSANRCN
jgi:hypothetical protein